MKKRGAFFLVFLCLWYFPIGLISASTPLIPNTDFTLDHDKDNLPDFWRHGHGNVPDQEPSRFGWELFPNSASLKAIWIIGGTDREGEWSCQVSGVRSDTDYVLRFYAYRDNFINKIYPEVEIFNQGLLLNNHCTSGGWQPFELYFNSRSAAPMTTLKFKNRYPVKFWFSGPELIPLSDYPFPLPPEEQRLMDRRMEFVSGQENFFPIGMYGLSRLESLVEVKRVGFNTVIIPPKEELVRAASDMGMKCILNICSGVSDPNSIISIMSRFASSPSLFSWYIADEPELSPFRPHAFAPLIKKLNQIDPLHPTCMAMNRAWLVPNYQPVNNLFFMDEYPIPHMPITWLSDSLDQAVSQVGSQRVWSVVQAFGGSEHKGSGWPRFPTYHELRALTYLSLIHDASGLLYYSYPHASSSQTDWKNLAKIVSELQAIYPWLTIPKVNPTKESPALSLAILSPYKADAEGRAAIHFALKKRGDHFLLLTVNTSEHPVQMSMDGLPGQLRQVSVLFEQRKIVLKQGNLFDEFAPFETHIYGHGDTLPSS
ncbi:MAG: hypothetical protein ACMUIA_08315 [bacterium]